MMAKSVQEKKDTPLPLESHNESVGLEGEVLSLRSQDGKVSRNLLVKVVFTLELELGNSDLHKIPLKVSSNTSTPVGLTHDLL